jgi:hypothetical protein
LTKPAAIGRVLIKKGIENHKMNQRAYGLPPDKDRSHKNGVSWEGDDYGFFGMSGMEHDPEIQKQVEKIQDKHIDDAELDAQRRAAKARKLGVKPDPQKDLAHLRGIDRAKLR